jgi:hypothetical protein
MPIQFARHRVGAHTGPLHCYDGRSLAGVTMPSRSVPSVELDARPLSRGLARLAGPSLARRWTSDARTEAPLIIVLWVAVLYAAWLFWLAARLALYSAVRTVHWMQSRTTTTRSSR